MTVRLRGPAVAGVPSLSATDVGSVIENPSDRWRRQRRYVGWSQPDVYFGASFGGVGAYVDGSLRFARSATPDTDVNETTADEVGLGWPID
jgi:hypothetical protein